MDIDIIVNWVDDSDPAWLAERNRYAEKPLDCDSVRFRNWDNLRYWFRAVEKYMPWVRKVFFVTCGHYPAWLNFSHPKLEFVTHSDYIPAEYLPTFSARPIELNFHRIEGLSEHFIYFNDDFFPSRPLSLNDFFIDGVPCMTPVISPLIALRTDWAFGHTLLNDISLINAHFNLRDVMRKNRRKWFSPKLGKNLIKNMYNSLGRYYFLGFESFHTPSPLLKSTLEKVWELEPEILDRSSRYKFRKLDGVNQYVFLYYQYCTNNFVPVSTKQNRYFDLKDDNREAIDAVKSQKYKCIILNDSDEVTDFEKVKADLIEAFESVLPEKSGFEKG